MTYLVRTIVLFLIGLWLKRKFRSELNFNSIKIVMMQVFLPAVIFFLILNQEASIGASNLWSIIAATLFLNIFTFACACYLLPRLLPGLDQRKVNTNAVMLSAFAPCITVVPLAAALSTDVNATYAVLFDIGDKFFIFVMLFAYISLKLKVRTDSLRESIGSFLRKIILQPINLALLSSLFLSSQGITFGSLPPLAQQLISDIKSPLLILIPIFIAGVIDFQNISRTLVSVLSYKYGFGLCCAATFLYFFPGVITAGLGLLVVTAPLASSSMWAKQNLTEFDYEFVSKKFDLEFAEDLFSNSFGISLLLNYAIFLIGEPAVNPLILGIIGLSLMAFAAFNSRNSRPSEPQASKMPERELAGTRR